MEVDYTAKLSDRQRARFYTEFQQACKQDMLGVLLALFLGGLGAHHFYMRRSGLGIMYLLFCWTGVTTIIGRVECFYMPGCIRVYNYAQATLITAQVLAASSPSDGSWPTSLAPQPGPTSLA